MSILKRLSKTMEKLHVDKAAMKRNFDLSREAIVAEPLYILLAHHGHPNAHEHVKEMTLKSQQEKIPFSKLINEDESLKPYLKKFTKQPPRRWRWRMK